VSSQVEELLHQIHEFVTDFTQTKVSKSEFSFFLACLRASLAKSYEFLLFSHRDTESEGYFFAVRETLENQPKPCENSALISG
jgi:hypothetical protein